MLFTSTIWQSLNGTGPLGVTFNFRTTPFKTCISSCKLKLPESKGVLWGSVAAIVLIFALAYYFLMPVAEVVTVRRGTAISAVYGTVRIEPASRRSGDGADRTRSQSQIARSNNEKIGSPDEERGSPGTNRRPPD